MNTIIVKVAPELVERFFTQGNTSSALETVSGIPPGSRLFAIAYQRGSIPCHIWLYFETDAAITESPSCVRISSRSFELMVALKDLTPTHQARGE